MIKLFKMKKFDLIVVSYEPFPYGKAATNRMLSYLTGLAKEKSILYLCLASPSFDTPNKRQYGIHNEILFRYLSNPVLKRKRLIVLRKAISLCWRYLLLIYLLFSYSTKSVLLYSSKPFLNKLVFLICRIKKNNVFLDKTELVGYNYSKETSELLRFKNDTKKLSGLIVISPGLYDYFDNVQPEQKFLLPVLVDMSRFIHQKKEKFFFCCSGANLERDGLLDCLTGFLLFYQSRKDYVFQIASTLNLNDAYHKKCKDIIDQHPDCIQYLGHLPSYEIPNKLSKATALLLTPHTNYETKGFPTKLGEYLASGTPVICSSIDDLMSVISSTTAFIVSPNSPTQIAKALQTIVDNKELAEEVGYNGSQLMQNFYTIHAYKDNLINFLKIN